MSKVQSPAFKFANAVKVNRKGLPCPVYVAVFETMDISDIRGADPFKKCRVSVPQRHHPVAVYWDVSQNPSLKKLRPLNPDEVKFLPMGTWQMEGMPACGVFWHLAHRPKGDKALLYTESEIEILQAKARGVMTDPLRKNEFEHGRNMYDALDHVVQALRKARLRSLS